MTADTECDDCGLLQFTFETDEELRDKIALHLMLAHGATEWVEKGVYNGS